MSGYDLRKIFASTAMGSFSDSPGAIYPALRRLETGGLAHGHVQPTASLRKRRLYRLTPKGLAAFKAWLKKPVTRDDVIRRIPELMMRFAFMGQTLGEKRTAKFLGEFARELQDYIPVLKQYLESYANEMPLSGRLALECGIQGYEAQLRWAKSSISLYERKRRKQA
jgi:DNA-binding PadR family transcriptional regulator